MPDEEWDAIASLGIDAVWLMGVWERSPTSIRVSNANATLQADFRRALPDYTLADNVGSAYCVKRYFVDGRLGGSKGLGSAREHLARHGLRLVLDFVPNHVALDHAWVVDHPEYLVSGRHLDLAQSPAEFFEAGGRVIAYGRDPHFLPWRDTAQLNAFDPGLRQAAIQTANAVADQCDGMRCDMAMLLLNSVFERTWGKRAGTRPAEEYWPDLISAVRARHPNLLFIAEAYWDLEWKLQELGFDCCYDKPLYDRLEYDTAESIRLHLTADLDYQDRLVRFIENHDEPRAAVTFSPEKERAAAVTILTLPGAKLLYEGQLEGRRVRVPVFLGRRPTEPVDADRQAVYRKLLCAANAANVREGEWQLCERCGWPDNASYLNLVAWCWRSPQTRHLVVVNFAEQRSQGRVRLPWDDLAGRAWRLDDLVSGAIYNRDGAEMGETGLYVDLDAWGFHFLSLGPA